MRPERLGDGADDVQAVRAAPEQRRRPEVAEESVDAVEVVDPEEVRERPGRHGGSDDDGREQDVEVAPVEGVDRPGGARPRRRSGGEGGEVGRRGAGEVRAGEEEVVQLLVGPRTHVVREGSHDGGRLVRHGPTLAPRHGGAPRQAPSGPAGRARTGGPGTTSDGGRMRGIHPG